ncbi:YcnI family protein [Streptomyces tirandamycinicus]|uniref:YcnI family protein n=1 Tax=Streptomyces tirandamycinicus TaxID=2174846 RepID=UPI00226F4B25|nr:YcnI family protein [Streptomyces tirandamycinicus]MCY0980760.1 YcnI family protein [Streptomyces tirandamycinicus]
MNVAKNLPSHLPMNSAESSAESTAKSSARSTAESSARRSVARLAVAAGAAAASALLLCGPAFAHVSVQPEGEAAKGGFATVNFKVPNERDNASTVKLEITLPAGHPLSSVLPQPVPGWKAEVTRTTLDKPLTVHGRQVTEAASKITWTSAGGKIGPGQFQQFPVSLGQLPESTDKLVFKALQTYDNKEVVRWIEEPQQGAAEPDHPAPVLTLSAATGDHHGGSGTGKVADGAHSAEHTDDEHADSEHADSEATAASSTDSTARILAVVGIVVGAAGVAFGVLAGRRRSA